LDSGEIPSFFLSFSGIIPPAFSSFSFLIPLFSCFFPAEFQRNSVITDKDIPLYLHKNSFNIPDLFLCFSFQILDVFPLSSG